MSVAEEKVLEIYPICKHSNYGYKDLNEDKRKCYIEGYGQAEKDFMEKAVRWLEEKASDYIDIRDGQLVMKRSLITNFKKLMREQ